MIGKFSTWWWRMSASSITIDHNLLGFSLNPVLPICCNSSRVKNSQAQGHLECRENLERLMKNNWTALGITLVFVSGCGEIVTTSGGRSAPSRAESQLRTVP